MKGSDGGFSPSHLLEKAVKRLIFSEMFLGAVLIQTENGSCAQYAAGTTVISTGASSSALLCPLNGLLQPGKIRKRDISGTSESQFPVAWWLRWCSGVREWKK